MAVSPKTTTVSTKLLAVAERAKQWPHTPLRNVAHVIDPELLRASFDRLDGKAGRGIDGLSKADYAQDLDRKIADLHARLRPDKDGTSRYRHQPILRAHIPKEPGKTRPIGISSVEDKVVQRAVSDVLTALYEPEFMPCSYGFRPGRSAHGAIRDLQQELFTGRYTWVLEADIQSFFDTVDRERLMEMLRQRVSDESFLRLVGKCLRAGVLDGEEYSEPEVGTAQGSILSPLLGNVYLHHVLDVWFEVDVKPRLSGAAHLVRYADDFVILFAEESDARRVLEVLPKRMGKFGLQLHPDKTRLVPMARPPRKQDGGKGPGTFDFLGFTIGWRRSLKGQWMIMVQTRKARLSRAVKAIGDMCRRHRHEPLKTQHAALCKRLRGHYAYFGVSGNTKAIRRVHEYVRRLWFKWLRRRSERAHLNWTGYARILTALPLPVPRVRVDIWGHSARPSSGRAGWWKSPCPDLAGASSR